MALPNIFSTADVQVVKNRINGLNTSTQPLWGKMSVDQMLAHLNVSYEMIYEDKHKQPNAFVRFILKTILKPIIVSEKPYKKNSGTAPQFIIKGNRDFDAEKQRLLQFLDKTQQLGAAHFDGKNAHSFGVMNATEWNNMLYKHLNHHLGQFGV
jgi:hypothetical protein